MIFPLTGAIGALGQQRPRASGGVAVAYAAQFSGTSVANAKFLSVANNSTLQSAANNWEIDLYVNFDSVAGNHAIACKSSSTTLREWDLRLESSKIRLLILRPDGSGTGSVSVIHTTTIVAGQWYRVQAGRNHSTTTAYLSLDGGAAQTVSSPTTPGTNGDFFLGRSSGAGTWLNAKMDTVKWSKGGVLVSQWDFQDASNLGLDSVGSNHLTNTNSVTQTGGVA